MRLAIALTRPIALAAFVILAGPVPANEITLNNAEVRSAIGAPLDIRIALKTRQADLDPACFAVHDAGGGAYRLAREDLRLSVVDTRQSQHLLLQGAAAYDEPAARFALRVGCPGEAPRIREFTVLIDPAPGSAPGPAPAGSARSTHGVEPRRAIAVPAAAGVWLTRSGDSINTLAGGIHPQDAARRAQYAAALRALNPTLAAFTDDAALPNSSALILPDLKDLSGILPGPPQTTKRPGPPPARTDGTRVAVATLPDNAAAPTRVGPVQAAPAPGRFRLRLSAPELDLSAQQDVTPKLRALLRERQRLLDADEYLAAQLALRNTVQQLEARVQGLRLKLTQSTRAADTPNDTPAPANAPAAVAAPPSPAAAPIVAEPSTAAAPATVAVNAAVAVTPPAMAPLAPAPAAEQAIEWSQSLQIAMLAGGAVVLALIGLWFGRARLRKPARSDTAMAISGDASLPAAQDPQPPALVADAADASGDRVPASPDLMDEASFDPQWDANTIAMVQHAAADSGAAATADGASPAQFNLDEGPATTADFLPGAEERPDEDRMRRVQYMYERYPELMTRSASIDDADSVINAARLYYEESQRDRACELLTFGVEERPQEMRFWLAQFEIFRLENMADEFTALAAKFHVFFGANPVWPKVQHIGHELDPANPLFAVGRDAQAGEEQFDPVAENWLNAPIDFTTHALMSDLRRALFDDHRVDRPDFDSITSRLAAGAARRGQPA